MDTNIQDIQELLQEAIDKVYEAADSLKRARSMMKELSYGYNISGNMDAYVINYLTDGCDSITDKIEKYLEETNALENEDKQEIDETEEEL